MKREAKTKLAELPIMWTEKYTSRTKFLKEQYKAVVGTGSYFRWEGKNTHTGDEYYVIVSPANIHKPKAMFFSGVRKLPSDYAAYGEYFTNIKEAIEYAHETWGVPRPTDMRHYDSKDLKGVDKRIKKWKSEKDNSKKEESKEKSKKKSYVIPDLIKEGMGRRHGDLNWANRDLSQYLWLNLKNLMARQNPDWETYEQAIQNEQSFTAPGERTPIERAFSFAVQEKNGWTASILKKYGLHDPNFYQMWIVHNPAAGTQSSYIVSVAPYASEMRDVNGNPIAKFDVFQRAVSTVTEEQVHAHRAQLINKIYDLYPWMKDEGINFGENDFVTAPLIGQDKGTIRLSDQGREKWSKALLDWYENAFRIETEDGRSFITRNKDATLQQLGEKGIGISSVTPLLTESLRTMIERDPKRGWKSELKRLSKDYYQQWADSLSRSRNMATTRGVASGEVGGSADVQDFLTVSVKPPLFNEDKIKTQVGSSFSSPLNVMPTFMIKKENYFKKPNLKGLQELELLSTEEIEQGDNVSLIAKIFLTDTTTGEIKAYRSGRPKRSTITIPLGIVDVVDHKTNKIRLSSPIDYDDESYKDLGFNPWSIAVISESGVKKGMEYGCNSLFTAYNALRSRFPQAEIPDFTQNVNSEFLSECFSRKRAGLPPPKLETERISERPEEDVFEQMRVQEEPPAQDVMPNEGMEEPEPVGEFELFEEQEIKITDFEINEKGRNRKKQGPKPVPVEEVEEEDFNFGKGDGDFLLSTTLSKLVKLAVYFEESGEQEKTEEMNKILRKHLKRN